MRPCLFDAWENHNRKTSSVHTRPNRPYAVVLDLVSTPSYPKFAITHCHHMAEHCEGRTKYIRMTLGITVFQHTRQNTKLKPTFQFEREKANVKVAIRSKVKARTKRLYSQAYRVTTSWTPSYLPFQNCTSFSRSLILVANVRHLREDEKAGGEGWEGGVSISVESCQKYCLVSTLALVPFAMLPLRWFGHVAEPRHA